MSFSLPSVGQVIADRYRVERVLGRGGMGVVLAARHIELDEIFALKVMTDAAYESPESVERFVREARTAARLKSVHVVKVVDTGRLPGGAPFLAMEYLSGSDLEKELRARGPLPPAEAAFYVIQACDALAEAHALGIVHRDIKPANLFLTRLPNGSPCIKVLDFGIAKQEGAQSGPRMTQTSSVFGTPIYMSPEQMKSSKSADARSDVWSLGVALYELCTGNVPYEGESMTALVAKVMTESPVPPSQRRAGIAPDFEAVVMRCLERDPNRRYPSAGALAQALAPIASGHRAPMPSAPDPGWARPSNPGMADPTMASPGASSPGMQSPGMSSPGMFNPGMSGPPMSSPGIGGFRGQLPNSTIALSEAATGPTLAAMGTQSAMSSSGARPAGTSSARVVLAVAAALALGSALAVFLVLRISSNSGSADTQGAASSGGSAPISASATTSVQVAPGTAEVVPAPATVTPAPATAAVSNTVPSAAPSPSVATGSPASPRPRPTGAPTAIPSSRPTGRPASSRGGFL